MVADTYGFHARRRSAGPSMRVEIWSYSRRNPFVPWTRFDLTSLPLLKGNAAAIGWWFLSLINRLRPETAQFRSVAGVAPGDPPAPWSLRG